MSKPSVAPSTAVDVRVWARAQKAGTFSDAALATVADLPNVRGRIHKDVRTAFNKAHKANPYVEQAHARKATVLTVPKVNSKTKSGVSLIKTAVQNSEIRSIARDLGLSNDKSRGPLKADVLAQVGAALLS